MSDLKPLVEELRGNHCPQSHGCGTMPICACARMEDAADALTAQASEIERLREALREIAALTGRGSVTDLARAALTGEEKG